MPISADETPVAPQHAPAYRTAMAPPPPVPEDRSGLPYALAAYFLWGLMPLYLLLVSTVPPTEFVGWRILWTVPVCLLIVAIRGQFAELARVFTNWRVLRLLFISSVLIAINWLTYVYAVMDGKLYGASLGYYLNPLVNVAIGTVFLGERLSWRQWLAVALAGSGVGLLLFGALDTLWITLTLAISFSLYGLVRKTAPVGALPGLTVEAILLTLPSVAVVGWFAMQTAAGSAMGVSLQLDLLIICAGVVTGVPLLLFATAARSMPYSLLGFVQFIAPTMVFVLGLTVFDEALRPAQLACFVLIWAAIALFCWDLWAKRPVRQPSIAQPSR